MRSLAHSFLLIVLSFFISSCGSKQFTQGEYDDLSQKRLLDDKFNESDMEMIASKMIDSLVNSRIIKNKKKPPVVMVTLMTNRTQEHIDMTSLSNKVRAALVNSGRFRFTTKEMRADLAEELQYQGQSGFVDPATARKQGKQIGAEYMLTGQISDRVQEVGDKKYIYYISTFNLVNIQTGLLDWTGIKELRKAYTKKRVSF